MKKPYLLVLDSDFNILSEVKAYLNDSFEVQCVSTLKEARYALSQGTTSREFSVFISEMELQEDRDAGLKIAKELNARAVRPEIVILTARPNIENASRCMSAGVFGYVDKGQEDSYAILKNLCVEANAGWHQRHWRIPTYMLEHPVALLFGDMFVSIDILRDISESEAARIEHALHSIARHETKAKDGQSVKCSGTSFLSIFSSVAQALKAALAIQYTLTSASCLSLPASLQLREIIHWGVIKRIRNQNEDEITGVPVIECVRGVE